MGAVLGAIREVITPVAGALEAARPPDQAGALAVRGGDFLFVCGLTAGHLPSGDLTGGTTAGQSRQVLTTLEQLLAAAGSSLAQVVKVNVFLDSMLEAPNMNEVYARFFPDPPPARTVCGARLPPGVKVMIECTALA
jgi:2-iminobutanoate/2-iminopropanoate deaminase